MSDEHEDREGRGYTDDHMGDSDGDDFSQSIEKPARPFKRLRRGKDTEKFTSTDLEDSVILVRGRKRGNKQYPEKSQTNDIPLPAEVPGKGKKKVSEKATTEEEDSLVPSRCTPAYLDKVARTFGISGPYELSLVPEGELANVTTASNTITLHTEHLQSGIRFPLDPLYEELSQVYRVPLGQMHPNAIRHFSCFLKLCRAHGIVPRVRLFACLYSMTLVDNQHYAHFRFRPARKGYIEKVVLGMQDSLKDWREDFFRVSRSDQKDFESCKLWVNKPQVLKKHFFNPGDLELASIAILNRANKMTGVPHANHVCPKVPFKFWPRKKKAGPEDVDIDVSRLLKKPKGKKKKTNPAVPNPSAPGLVAEVSPAPNIHQVDAAKDLLGAVGPSSPVHTANDDPERRDFVSPSHPVIPDRVSNSDEANQVLRPHDKQGMDVIHIDSTTFTGKSQKRKRSGPSYDTSSASEIPVITPASFFDWMSLCCSKNKLAVTVETLPVADEIARVTTLPDDLEGYQKHSPRLYGRMVSSLGLQVSQIGHLATEAYEKLYDDWSASSEQLKIEKDRLSAAEKDFDNQSHLVKEQTDRIKVLEEQNAADSKEKGLLLSKISDFEAEKTALLGECEARIKDLTNRNDKITARQKEEIRLLREDAKGQEKTLSDRLAARDDEWKKKLSEKEEKMYENLRQILRAGQYKVDDAAKKLGGDQVDLTPFVLDVKDLVAMVPTLPPEDDEEDEEEDFIVTPEEHNDPPLL